jgi:hypothetical protein
VTVDDYHAALRRAWHETPTLRRGRSTKVVASPDGIREPGQVRALGRAVQCWALAFAVLAHGTLALAEEDPLAVAVRYSGPAGCNDVAVFWRALSARTNRVSPNDLTDAEIVLDVQLRKSRRGVLGMLQIVRSGTETEPRYVEAQRCNEVIEALALTAALGIDPEALTRVPEAEPESKEEDEPPPAPAIPWRWRGSLEAALVASLAVDLEASWGFWGGVSAFAERDSVWAPKLRLGAGVTHSDVFDTAGSARFTVSAVQLDACPLRIGSDTVALRTCATAQWGALTGEGRNINTPLTSRRPWLALGPMLELEVRLSDALRWQVDLAGIVPLFRQQYTLGLLPERIAMTPAISPWLSLGLTYAP